MWGGGLVSHKTPFGGLAKKAPLRSRDLRFFLSPLVRFVKELAREAEWHSHVAAGPSLDSTTVVIIIIVNRHDRVFMTPAEWHQHQRRRRRRHRSLLMMRTKSFYDTVARFKQFDSNSLWSFKFVLFQSKLTHSIDFDFVRMTIDRCAIKTIFVECYEPWRELPKNLEANELFVR